MVACPPGKDLWFGEGMAKINEKITIRVAPFGMDFVFTLYYLAAPLLLIDLKANPIHLGLVGTLASCVHMGMAHIMGRVSDRLGRRRLIITAPLIFLATCLLMTRVGQIWIILALSVLNGLSVSIYWPSLQAWIADCQKGAGQTGLARDIGTFNLSWTAAALAGPILSGFLYSLHPKLPFLVGAAIALMLFVLVYTSVRESRVKTAQKTPTIDMATSNRRRSFLYAAWTANFTSWFIMGNARYQFPMLARELGIPHHTIGLLIGFVGLALFTGFFLLRRTDRWLFSRGYLFGAQLLSLAGISLLLVSKGFTLFAVGFIMIGLSCSLTYYSSLYYAVHLLKEKGKGTGLHESILGGGAVLGPILGGVAAQYVGLRAPYLLCLIVLLAALGAQFMIMKKDKNLTAK
ncbi:MAG: MFS transporter [Deltaproteobacteria bacterium]|nr:MFS transporter [Deltaproteobacteria bacterium]